MKVIGYFGQIKDANRAKDKLKGSGFNNVVVDLNDHYIGNKNVERDVIGTEGALILSDLVLDSGSASPDIGHGTLRAASPVVSGYGRIEEITDINYTVTLECDEGDVETAKNIMSEMGGYLDNPNVSRYETAMRSGINIDKAVDQIVDNNLNI